MKLITILLTIFLGFNTQAQKPLTSQILEKSTIRFKLNEDGYLDEEARKQWLDWIGENEYVGLAEVHNSAQLSLLTKALLNVLDEKGFNHFAMEMGPNTAEILQKKTENYEEAEERIKELNQTYGKKSSFKTPLIFVNKKEDAAFIEEASKLGFNFWGIDQEFDGSYVMLLDHIYAQSNNREESVVSAYNTARSVLQKNLYKKKYCWFQSNEEINNFFALIEDEKSLKTIVDIRMSWDIYCKHTQGGSNQLRANYMKKNFVAYLQSHGSEAKVFTKLGNVHLTHGISPYGVHDIGKYLTDKTKQDDKDFLIIRHLIAYRNGKSNIGKSGWKSVNMFLELGRKDQWTVVDLRPFREMLKNGELVTNEKFTYELNSYDLLIISPDDQYPKVNY